MKNFWLLTTLLIGSLLLTGCNKTVQNPEIIDDCVTVDWEDSCAVDIDEPVIEEPIVEETEPSLIDWYIPVLALYSTRDLTTEERNSLPISIGRYYDNFSIDIIDWTRVCIIKIDREAFESKELKNDIIANIMWMHFEPITDISVINNGNFEKHFDLYDNWAIKEQWVYINGEKRWLWTTYDEDWNIISSNEYIVW
jgi:hypothetical protein